jgi:hypothetical protein
LATLLAASAAGVVLTPALAAGGKRAPAVSITIDPASGFTPAIADPRLAAAFAGKAPSLSEFKFTPAAAKTRPSQVRVAIRAKASTPAKARAADALADSSSPISAITPASYNLGVAVGWRRFAVSGDVAKVKTGTPALGGRESAVVGVSYSLKKKLTGRLAVGADRDDGRAAAALRSPDKYSLDLGGAYSLTKRIALTGGVRYSIDRDRDTALRDNRRDSQAVYVGTAFKF